MAQSVVTVDDEETVRLALKDFLCEDLFNFCYDDEPPFSSSDIASSRAAEQPTSTTTNSNSFALLSSSHSCQIKPPPLTSSTYIPKALSPFIPLEPSSSRLSTSRFTQPKTDKQVQTQWLEGIPKSTLHYTRYCVNLWEQWRTNRCKITGEHIGSIDSLSDQSLNHWQTRFILEVRKQDGSEYPPNTLHHITAGLMQHLRWSGKAQIDIFKDATFAKFRSSLDAEMKRL